MYKRYLFYALFIVAFFTTGLIFKHLQLPASGLVMAGGSLIIMTLSTIYFYKKTPKTFSNTLFWVAIVGAPVILFTYIQNRIFIQIFFFALIWIILVGTILALREKFILKTGTK
jgi:hypothetical protein